MNGGNGDNILPCAIGMMRIGFADKREHALDIWHQLIVEPIYHLFFIGGNKSHVQASSVFWPGS